ncbi:TlpA family protein disulfide reductase [Tardiphaga alba]|uniref:TlpA family protein disulfide reductase n=1 Tax=Tardiphaga alba TaxID=340268 RepID=A0ABX8AJ75_9BRAD|nr:TlpA family protein disulfide reductase [Tardiphaga alba]
MDRAPEWRTTEWFNTPSPLSLADLRGKIVMLTAFQMLCPGCVAEGLPQAQRVAATFKSSDVAVIGLHSVFEHHDAMGPAALRAFLHEYKIRFPVGVDAPDGPGLPHTMRDYGFQGTPTTLLFDREGQLRRHVFGHIADLQLGAELMALICEQPVAPAGISAETSGVCTIDGCR